MKRDDFLIEIQTEELPPKTLSALAKAFEVGIQQGLEKANLDFKTIQHYATPRRLSVIVTDLISEQPTQTIERKGPSLKAAYDANGQPTQAMLGFARACHTEISQLGTRKTEQGEHLSFEQLLKGQSLSALVPEIVNQALASLPIAKRMRWGDSPIEFVRPVHSVILLYGEAVIEATILGCKTGRTTQGHRFLCSQPILIDHPAHYLSLLLAANVMAAVSQRQQLICDQIVALTKNLPHAKARISPALLDEVTNLVEWPTAVLGHFDEKFLALPQEVTIAAMQDHQRYFPVENSEGLLPYFIAISNLEAHDMQHIIHGNERVLRARLADAHFFYKTDKKVRLADRAEQLKPMLFQKNLGSLHDKALRLAKLTPFIFNQINKGHAGSDQAEAVGFLAKCDLTTEMVGEFPELQGIMGGYYIRNESSEAANAIAEHYLPRFSGDRLPQTPLGQALAIADRIDNLVGAFGTHNIPTGDKDPFALRRAAIGILRMMIENHLALGFEAIIKFSISQYGALLAHKNTQSDLLSFLTDRLKVFYQEEGHLDVFQAIAALNLHDLWDMHQRYLAVKTFKTTENAQALSSTNKRVSNILAKYTDPLMLTEINPALFEMTAEKNLFAALQLKNKLIAPLIAQKNYAQVLQELAELKNPIDNFFDEVLVMAEAPPVRENRLLLLKALRALFLQVADIAFLV